MKETWILVANSSEAHLYSIPRAKLLGNSTCFSHLHDLNHPQSREKLFDLITDKQGYNRHGNFVYSDVKQHETEVFARTITKFLDQQRRNGLFDDLIIIASPKLDGKIKKFSSPDLKHMVSLNISKDYTKCNEKQLFGYIKRYV